MATREASPATTTGCPCCRRARYAFRVPARFDDKIRLSRHYRCAQYGGWIYVHELHARSPAGMAGVDGT